MTFELPPLPYAYDGLEPVISAETMRLHHGKHHQAYTNKLNELVAADATLQGKTIEQILAAVSSAAPAVRNNGGGYWNHAFFWQGMAPKGTTRPAGKLEEAIKAYGGLDKLKGDFDGKGAGQFGSGWAWLVADGSGALRVTSTPNQDSPFMDVVEEAGVPILTNDVWEHAYYLNYRNDRGAYLDAWWQVVNWDEVGRRFDRAIQA